MVLVRRRWERGISTLVHARDKSNGKVVRGEETKNRKAEIAGNVRIERKESKSRATVVQTSLRETRSQKADYY